MVRRAIRLITFSAMSTALVLGQHHHEPPADAVRNQTRLLDGTGTLHHPVSTTNVDAQKFFDQGLRMIFGFNHGEALRSFERAAELDPDLAMAYWGIALSLGPNINSGMDEDAHKKAYEAAQKALSLRANASKREQGYIDAIAARYSADPKADTNPLQRAYADAMRKLAHAYPDDLDAQTLFAESLMNLYPWKLWSLDGKPAPVTEEAVRTLEDALERDPYHMGANHYYIHAVEASPQPQRALAAADRLGTLAPGIGHLVHMPAHIYMRTGDYERAAKANADAAAADKAYLEQGGVKGIYFAYYAHNLHFLSAAYSMQGRYADSQRAAEECSRIMAPIVEAAPGLQSMIIAEMLVPVRFRDWERVQKMPEPDRDQITLHNLWNFARGMAFASTGDLKQAIVSRDRFREGIASLPKDRTYGNNPEHQVMQLPLFLLEAKIAEARNDFPGALGHLKEAVATEDGLSYNEPPDWYYPPGREALGGLLLRMKHAGEAEDVFREDLRRNQRNGRSLFGLHEALKAQNKLDEARLVEPLYGAAWSKADRPLTQADLF
jgi:tetratricopeptide (TPR) repeat protein